MAQKKMVKEKVFVTGACGFLGKHLVEALQQRGASVFALVKPYHATTFLEERGIPFVCAELFSRQDYEDFLPAGCSVLHCYSLSPAAYASSEEYSRQNVLATQVLLDVCRRKKIKKFVYISSLSVIGPHAQGPLAMTEETQPHPDNAYGQSKFAAERLVSTFYHELHIPVSILRLSTLYGPYAHTNSVTFKLFKLARKPFQFVVGGGRQPYELNYIKNIVPGVLLALDKVTTFKIYNLGDTQKKTYRQVIVTFAHAAGSSIRLFSLPFFFLVPFAKIGDLFGRLRGKRFLFDSRTLSGLLGAWSTSYAKAEEELGFYLNMLDLKCYAC